VEKPFKNLKKAFEMAAKTNVKKITVIGIVSGSSYYGYKHADNTGEQEILVTCQNGINQDVFSAATTDYDNGFAEHMTTGREYDRNGSNYPSWRPFERRWVSEENRYEEPKLEELMVK
jgi:hypothetical protein